jgi:hypothetical protein
LAAAFLRREGYTRQAKGQELDDLYADALGAIAWALHTWRADGGRSFASWAWQTMARDVPRAQVRRHRWRMELTADRDLPRDDEDPVWLRSSCVEDGYAHVDARDELERICRWAALTPAEAEGAEFFAVHGGTLVKHLGGQAKWFPERNRRTGEGSGAWYAAKKKLRAAAAAHDEWFEFKQEAAA